MNHTKNGTEKGKKCFQKKNKINVKIKGKYVYIPIPYHIISIASHHVTSHLQQRLYITLVLNTSNITLLDTTESQSRNQSGTDTGTIFGGQNYHLVRLIGLPVEDLTEGLGTTGFEVGIFSKDGTVGADVAALDVLLPADSGDTTGGESCSAGSNQFGQTTEEFQFGAGGFDTETAFKEFLRIKQVLVRVFFDGGQEGCVEVVRLMKLGGILAFEKEAWLVLQDIEQGQTVDLTEVETSSHLLEGLLAWTRGVTVDGDIVLGERKDHVLVIEGAILAVDSHGHVGREAEMSNLGDRAHILHIGSVDTSSENAANHHLGVSVVRGNQRSGSVIDQSRNLDGQFLR